MPDRRRHRRPPPLLDRPVSNSGRLRALLLAEAEAAGARWGVELADDTDRRLAAAADGTVVATSDAHILDRAAASIDLPAAAIAREVPGAWRVRLGPAR